MPDPKGKLVTPVGFTAAGVPKALLCDVAGKLVVSGGASTTSAKARAYLDNIQSNIADDTWTKVLLDATSYDPSSMFANYKFTSQVDGYYSITASIQWDDSDLVANRRYFGALYRDGTRIVQNSGQAAIADYLSVFFADIRRLEVGQYLELYAKHQAGNNLPDIMRASPFTYMSVHLLSAF